MLIYVVRRGRGIDIRRSQGRTMPTAEDFRHVDAKQKRLAEISGKLMSEVKFGGGVLGHLHKGGTFLVKQQDLGSGHWEITVLDVQMIGKALFFKTIDVAEKDSYTNFQPVTEGTTLAKAAQLLAEGADNTSTLRNGSGSKKPLAGLNLVTAN